MRKNNRIGFVRYLVIILIIFTSSIGSYAHSVELQLIASRGLVFQDGMASDEIRLLKDFFRIRGESNVPWGYSYDSKTKDLVKKFQKEKGIKQTGKVNKETLDLINKEIIDKEYKLSIRQPELDTNKDRIVINKSSNTLYFFKNGQIYRTYPVGTGKTPDKTPDGKHTIVTKAKNPYWGGAGVSDPIPGGDPSNPLGKRWMGISYGGGASYGIHGNSNPSSIGKYVSLGCIRMFNGDVEKFYEEVKKGTEVWIGNESTLIAYGVKFNDKFKVNYTKDKPLKDKSLIDKPKEVYDIQLVIKEEIYGLNHNIVNYKGINYYPMEDIVSYLGGGVETLPGEIKLSLGGKDISFPIESNISNVDGGVNKNIKAFTLNGKAYMPIRESLETFGYSVKWNEEGRLIIID